MRLRSIPVLSVAAALFLAHAARTYEHPLNEQSISEAYSLGRRNDETMDKFLAQYFKRLPEPETGPYIHSIEVQSPYVQLVWRVHLNPMTYSERQAQKGYAYPFDEFLVRVGIEFTSTYQAYVPDARRKGQYVRRPDNFWKEFQIRVLQVDEVAPTDAIFTPTYMYLDEGPRIWTGGDVTLKFDGSSLRSEPIRIEVLTPDGQTVKAEFDLGALR